jgi:hypothetical protein
MKAPCRRKRSVLCVGEDISGGVHQNINVTLRLFVHFAQYSVLTLQFLNLVDCLQVSFREISLHLCQVSCYWLLQAWFATRASQVSSSLLSKPLCLLLGRFIDILNRGIVRPFVCAVAMFDRALRINFTS